MFSEPLFEFYVDADVIRDAITLSPRTRRVLPELPHAIKVQMTAQRRTGDQVDG